MDRADPTLAVEVVYSPRARQVDCVPLRVPAGCLLRDAVVASALVERHGLVMGDLSVAIWGRRVGLQEPLRDGDRIELCRALTVDPKQARRLRYKAQRKEKRPPSRPKQR
jgi:putative ubiquitin-RnfH superfamily antitoxin RatB of RatAB toxin-antitoxin module